VLIDKKKFEKAKSKIENDLKNYPYWLIAIETPNLGYPTKWGVITEKSTLPWERSYVEKDALDDIEKRWKVDVITKVLSKLDDKSKKIIEEWYFRDTTTREELLEQLQLDKNKFYYYRNRALGNFMVALGYI
jgi:ArpU family phage transcriptional regulator